MTTAAPAAEDAVRPARRRRGRWVLLAIALVVAVVVGVRVVSRDRAASGGSGGAAPGAKGGGKEDRPVAVQVAVAATRDLPITLDGLGTVTAYKTVNVRAQVDGRLDRVVFQEGQAVKRGELLAEIDPRPFTIQLHTAEAALARDQAQLAGAERNLERYAEVVKDRLIPQQQVDDQRALVDQLRGTIKSDQAQIENARLMLDYARIKAPIDGVTGVRQVDPGNLVRATDPTGIVVVAQMDPIAVLFTLPQDDLPRIAAEQGQGKAKLAVQALSREGDKLLATGELALIDNQINQTTATIRLKAVFPNPARTLWPNQFVKTRLVLSVQKGALVVPAVAVQRGPQGAFVYGISDDGKAVVRPVEVDAIQGETAVLAKGVSPGDRIVVEGQSQLKAGSRVSVAGGKGEGGGGKGEGQGKGGKRRP